MQERTSWSARKNELECKKERAGVRERTGWCARKNGLVSEKERAVPTRVLGRHVELCGVGAGSWRRRAQPKGLAEEAVELFSSRQHPPVVPDADERIQRAAERLVRRGGFLDGGEPARSGEACVCGGDQHLRVPVRPDFLWNTRERQCLREET